MLYAIRRLSRKKQPPKNVMRQAHTFFGVVLVVGHIVWQEGRTFGLCQSPLRTLGSDSDIVRGAPPSVL